MPRISSFYGIVIAMFYDDHDPPHFHVIYGEHRAVFGISPIAVLRGSLPRRAEGLVFEWAATRQVALEENWGRARRHEPLQGIPGLD